jgi:hypothetical protein
MPFILQHITDLLTPRSDKSLSVRVHPKNGPFVDGLSAEPVSSGELLLYSFSTLRALHDCMKLLDDVTVQRWALLNPTCSGRGAGPHATRR